MPPRFFAPAVDVEQATATLPADEAHHLLHVLRLGPGTEVAIFDGRGHEWSARVVSASKARGVTVELFHERTPVAEPPIRVTLGVGVLKGDQMDTVVRDATMLGVSAIVPVVSEHVTVSARAWRGGAAIERWMRVAVSSAKQCGRAVVPAILPVEEFKSLIARTTDPIVMCVEPVHAGAAPVDLRAIPRPAGLLALVGPEGGWSTAEIGAAARHSARFVHLGPRTLRAESAPIVLLSALWTAWGW